MNNTIESKLLKYFIRSVKKYNFVKENDKIAVAVSGGKDSLTLLKLFCMYKKISNINFSLIAILINLNNDDKEKYKDLILFCKNLDVELKIKDTNIQNIVFNVRKEKNPCSLCSKMRKGALYLLAKENNCNKVALGHHRDDFIDTFFLSMLYENRLYTLSPLTYLTKIQLTIIRPLIYIKEADICSYSKNFPIVVNNCPANKATKRTFIKDIIKNISNNYPNFRNAVFNSLINIDKYHLLNNYNYNNQISND